MNYWLLLVPLLSAFTGWIAIKIALAFMFEPAQPRQILGIRFQGIIPKQQHKIALFVGKAIAAEFASYQGFEERISDPSNMERLKPFIEVHIDDFLRNKLKEQMPMIAMFIGDKTISSLKTIFMQELETLFPQVMQQFAGNLKNDLDVEGLVVSKIESIDPATISALLHTNLHKELALASAFGALIGLFIGLIQLAVIWLTN